MTNLQKRILTSVIILPLSIFFILKGGYFLLFYLLSVFFIANYELFSVFRKIKTILFLDFVLIVSLFSIYYLTNNQTSFYLLLWVIILVICSDIGGYVFGKIFKWKKLTKISPKKTLSGALGSLIFSLGSVFLLGFIIELISSLDSNFFYKPRYFILAIVFSIAAQFGDLLISYLKRKEKIKDTGKLLPGHGGIFDRIDSLMPVVILAYILYNLQLFP